MGGQKKILPNWQPRRTTSRQRSTKKDLETAFLGEENMDMVEGLHTKQQAAEACDCTTDELIHGPMAAAE